MDLIWNQVEINIFLKDLGHDVASNYKDDPFRLLIGTSKS